VSAAVVECRPGEERRRDLFEGRDVGTISGEPSHPSGTPSRVTWIWARDPAMRGPWVRWFRVLGSSPLDRVLGLRGP
jgi:hypothetical protein